MSNRISRQEEYKIKKKLVLENIRRVFFASLVCIFVIPVMMLINKSNVTEAAPIAKGVLTCFEIFSVISMGMSYVALRNRDIRLSMLIYRTFWLLFEMFSFVIIYSDKVSGAGFTFFAILTAGLFLVPAMALSEQMYYVVILAVYSVFVSIKFKIGMNEIFNLTATVGMLFAMSRMMYGWLSERLALQEHEKEIKDNASIDALTGLLNRRGFEKRAFAEMQDCLGNRRRASMLMIDIDDMGKYNDSFGPEHGDDCIRAVSEYIKQIVLRNTGTICRLSGGRFLVFMEGGNEMEPVSLAEKVRTNVERKRIPQGRRSSNSFVTVSIGVASCIPRSESNFGELYDEAEDALFDAKERGKNVTVYEEQLYGRYENRKAAY